jgi:hypothetical protein
VLHASGNEEERASGCVDVALADEDGMVPSNSSSLASWEWAPGPGRPGSTHQIDTA